MGGAIGPRVRGGVGRSEDGGTEGRQDGGQNIQVLAGRLSAQRVGTRACDLGHSLTRVPTWRRRVQSPSDVSRVMLLVGLLGDGGRRGGGGRLVRVRGLPGRQRAEPLPTRLSLGSAPVGLQLLPGPAAHQSPPEVLSGRGLPPS